MRKLIQECSCRRTCLALALAALATLGSGLVLESARADGWTTDFEAAKAQAAREKKDVLIWITANWSAHDRKLKQRVFDDAEFQRRALSKFVLVQLEYMAAQEELKAKGTPGVMLQLIKRWDIQAFPTIVLTDAQGRGFARFSGYHSEGPDLFLAHLDWLRQIRILRDEFAAAANRTAGSRRAARLDRALSLIHPTLVHTDYQDWIADLLSWEGGEVANWSAKYRSLRREPPTFEAANLSIHQATPMQAWQLAEAAVLQNQLRGLMAAGQMDKVRESVEQIRQIRTRILGPYHKETADTINALAILNSRQGDFDRAEQYFWEALAISMALSGQRSPQSLGGITSLGIIYAIKSDFEKAEAALRLATEISRDNLDVAAASQSDQQQLEMAKSLRHRLDGSLSIAARSKDYYPNTYEQLLAWKGAVLARQQAVRSVADQPELMPKFGELQMVAAQLAKVLFTTPDASQAAAWQAQLQNLAQEKERIESQLSASSAAYRKTRRRVSLSDLTAALPKGFALVDCAEYRDQAFESNTGGKLRTQRNLLAFVVRPDQPVELVDLGNAGVIGEVIDVWRSDFGRSAQSAAAGQQLRELVWAPLEQYLDGVHTVLVSPDGVLGRMPWGAFPGNEAGKFLIEERAFAVIPAPQAVPSMISGGGEAKEAEANMLVLGGVDYDANLRGALLEDAGEPKKQFGRSRAVRGDDSLRFDSLAATGGELATIALTYRDNYGDRGITTLKGAAASETILRREAPRHLYLHLATHGFFSPPKIQSALSGDAGYDPGLLSGLALAGANRPQAEGDDGILTAAEVETLDLRRAELAVLSACETGLGEVAGGEGLLGLQRAFQVAGTKSVIASLWKVDDAATRDLMERFYENLWSRKKADGQAYTKLEALREAQLWMLKERGPRGLKEFEGDRKQETGDRRLPPYFWAAFVLSGDWR